jgi:hypothetical protein
MGGSVQTVSRTARAARWRGLAPRLVAGALVAVLCLAGIRSMFRPAPVVPPAPKVVLPDQPAEGFAEAFARAYLSWDSAAPDRHERQVAGFVSSDLDAGAGLQVPNTGSQQVQWTTVDADRPAGKRRRLVTVAAQTSAGLVHLAVLVARTDRGLLYVPDYPAILGPPPATGDGPTDQGDDVSDGALRIVAERAVRNYLAGQRANLQADLADDAAVALPDAPRRVKSVESTTGAGPNRVAVEVTAVESSGAQARLRYELPVVRQGGRWLVRAIQSNPITGGTQ